MAGRRTFLAFIVGLAVLAGGNAWADGVYKIGISAGLTGYAATVDRAWRDGVEIAAAALNAKGGILGRKIEVVVDDNHSTPLDAITGYRRMISSDKVNAFISGCVSAGNFAAAPLAASAEIPMVLCSVLPSGAAVKWTFSTIPPPRFEVEKRFEYIRDDTKIRKVGVLHDPSPYANLQDKAAQAEAGQYGLTLADDEQYQQDDTSLSVQISKMQAAGVGAMLKIGLGGTTLTAAKNIKALGLPMLMLTSIEDLAVFRPVAAELGPQFFFVASPSQVASALKPGPLLDAIDAFLKPWQAKYGDRDPNWAARGWDAVIITAAAVTKAGSVDGSKVRAALEDLGDFQGTTGIYRFTATNHYGITQNPYVLAQIIAGKTVVVK